MKHYPVTLLYVFVPALALLAMRDSARQDRNETSLRRAVETVALTGKAQLKTAKRELQQDFVRQSQAQESQVAILQRQLDTSLAVAKTLQHEVESLRTQLYCDVAALSTEIEPLREEVRGNSQRFANAIERERTERQQLAEKYDGALGQQSDLVTCFQQLADASRARALAEQQLAEQAASEAASLARLAARLTHDTKGFADGGLVSEVLVATALTHDADPEAAVPAESEAASVESSDESVVQEPAVPELSAPDA